MLLKMGKVSILLAVHNGEGFLHEALVSICNQGYRDWELIAVENGSTDRTLSLLEEWSKREPRIKVYSLKDKGKNKAYNFAFEHSQGEYVCFFAADDVLHPRSIQDRLEPLKVDSSLDFTTCLLQTVSIDRKYDGLVFPKNKNSPNFSGGSIFFRRALAKIIFPLPEILPNEDVWTSLHLKHFGIGKHIPKCLYFYRIHQSNSYGYHVDFDSKRKGFLLRMKAYRMFLEKNINHLSEGQKSYLLCFSNARDAAEEGFIRKIVFSDLPAKDKILMIYYCSPLLFAIKQRLFKILSGKLELI
jgi:glycosyltransferase involved in cell wall biosynthesis